MNLITKSKAVFRHNLWRMSWELGLWCRCRQRQDITCMNSAVEITCLCLQHTDTCIGPDHQNLSWPINLCLLHFSSWDILCLFIFFILFTCEILHHSMMSSHNPSARLSEDLILEEKSTKSGGWTFVFTHTSPLENAGEFSECLKAA